MYVSNETDKRNYLGENIIWNKIVVLIELFKKFFI